MIVALTDPFKGNRIVMIQAPASEMAARRLREPPKEPDSEKFQ